MKYKHADVLIAIANGEKAEFYSYVDGKWFDFCPNLGCLGESNPFSGSSKFRIKPKEPKYEWQILYRDCQGDWAISFKYFNSIEEWKKISSIALTTNISLYEPSKREVKE